MQTIVNALVLPDTQQSQRKRKRSHKKCAQHIPAWTKHIVVAILKYTVAKVRSSIWKQYDCERVHIFPAIIVTKDDYDEKAKIKKGNLF